VGKSFAFTIMLKGSIGGSIAEEALACSGRLLEMAHPAKPARITGCNRSECGPAHLVSPSSAGSFFHVHLHKRFPPAGSHQLCLAFNFYMLSMLIPFLV
jgi:hypothetical protein